jgi:hypothetical protein
MRSVTINQNMTSTKKLLICAALLMVSLCGLLGWKATDTQGQRAFSAVGVACSADGKTVYAADLDGVWKSEDGGKSWAKVTPK